MRFVRLALYVLLSGAAADIAHAQTARGYVEDARSRERLVGASVRRLPGDTGVATNAYGYFVLALADAEGPVRLRVSHVGYRDTTLALGEGSLPDLLIRLAPSDIEADTVEVLSVAAPNVPGATTLTAAAVRQLPLLLGEADVVRAFQFTPGVAAGNEGTTGLHVRGGSPDQNLLLLDGAPVYNANHLLGFASVFPEDAVASATLYRDGYPARYGGRLSSVLDIGLREGRRDRIGVRARASVLASALTVEGPFARGRGGYLLSGRRTYADLLLKPLLTLGDRDELRYLFWDGAAKVNLDLSRRTRLFASAYGGRDRFESAQQETFESGVTERQSRSLGWGNQTATARLAHVLSARAFASATLVYSRYVFDAAFDFAQQSPMRRDASSTGYGSALRDVGGRVDFDWAPAPGHLVQTGAGLTAHAFEPDRYRLRVEGGADAATDTASTARTRSTEAFAYLDDAFGLGPVRFRAGLHGAVLYVKGRAFPSVQPRL